MSNVFVENNWMEFVLLIQRNKKLLLHTILQTLKVTYPGT